MLTDKTLDEGGITILIYVPEYQSELAWRLDEWGMAATRSKTGKKSKSPDPCWKGYEKLGMKIKNGKRLLSMGR
ncbi:MAG: hypothetical protein JSS76_19380 [Bacteroidetes bacterium]|nr:hypothetical protein [Bacteroidota bacterium]